MHGMTTSLLFWLSHVYLLPFFLKAAVQMALGSASQLHRSVKNQVLHLVKIILHSLLNIAAIFCQHRPVHGGRNGEELGEGEERLKKNQ